MFNYSVSTVDNVKMFPITNEGDGRWSFTHDGDNETYYFASLAEAKEQSGIHYIAWNEFVREQIEHFNRGEL
jgi:hypothetical protein